MKRRRATGPELPGFAALAVDETGASGSTAGADTGSQREDAPRRDPASCLPPGGPDEYRATERSEPTRPAPVSTPTDPRPLVALSDGSQGTDGYDPLAGTPLKPGFRYRLDAGWTQPGPILVCAVCRHGTVLVDPQGVARHRTCPTSADPKRERGRA